jgi:hypothetical protein
MRKTRTLTLRCPDCGEEWVSKGERYRDDYYGWCLEIDEEYCPVCNTGGVVIDDEEGRYVRADRQYDNLVEERGLSYEL